MKWVFLVLVAANVAFYLWVTGQQSYSAIPIARCETDANVERFLRVVREFAKTTQFCMVTHNKLSMASSDTLHGVTMPEEGVSQLVSVQVVEELLDQAAG